MASIADLMKKDVDPGEVELRHIVYGLAVLLLLLSILFVFVRLVVVIKYTLPASIGLVVLQAFLDVVTGD